MIKSSRVQKLLFFQSSDEENQESPIFFKSQIVQRSRKDNSFVFKNSDYNNQEQSQVKSISNTHNSAILAKDELKTYKKHFKLNGNTIAHIGTLQPSFMNNERQLELDYKQKIEIKRPKVDQSILPQINYEVANILFDESENSQQLCKQKRQEIKIFCHEDSISKETGQQFQNISIPQISFVQELYLQEQIDKQQEQIKTYEEVNKGHVDSFIINPQIPCQVDNTVSILEPNQNMLQQSQYFFEELQQCKDFVSKNDFLNRPIKKGTRVTFEGYVSSNLLDRNYEFWFENRFGKKQLLLSAKKSLNWIRSSFYMMQFDDETKQFCMAAKLNTNFDNNQYHILNKEQNSKQKGVKILGSSTISVSAKGEKFMAFYYPKVDEEINRPCEIFKSSISSSLKEVFKQCTNDNISYLTVRLIKEQLLSKLKKQMCLKQSKKTISFKNKEGDLKLFIGKKQSKLYKLVAGSGLSPIQIFSILISHIQT